MSFLRTDDRIYNNTNKENIDTIQELHIILVTILMIVIDFLNSISNHRCAFSHLSEAYNGNGAYTTGE